MAKEKYIAFGGAVFAAFVLLIVYVYMENNALYNNSINTANVSQVGQQDNFPLASLPANLNGEAAIAALGDKLPDVAAHYGIDAEKLKNILRKDNSLHVDKNGRLNYLDSDQSLSVAGTSLNSDAIYPLEQTFALHSRPGASRVIYLDFDGHVFSNTSWNGYTGGATFTSGPYDLDGSPTFSDYERGVIQQLWASVSEDYLPFGVDVTTQDPGLAAIVKSGGSDNNYGVRAVVGSVNVTGRDIFGSAVVGSFGLDYDNTTIVCVVPYAGLPGCPENISHEVGHTMNLLHDGNATTPYYYGHGNWAPIMGVSYTRPIGHWSKGEYSGANNTQDDIAVMSQLAPIVTDDNGNAISSASNANSSGNTLTTSGVIERASDVDFFRFNSGSGQISLNVAVSPLRPNLDVRATLYDSAGTVLTSDNPTGYPPASLVANLSAAVSGGTYYIGIEGVGEGDPNSGYSDYGSLGQYYISGTIVGTNDNPPIAQMSANPSAGSAPLTVQFSSAGSSDPDGGQLTYSWNFGDGTAGSSSASPMHTYNTLGTFTATLTVTDPSNLSASKSTTITAQNLPPVANFTSSVSSNNIPATVTFDASSSSDPDGTITSYTWDFGDGSQGTGITTSHTYTTANTFAARLTVTDNSGQTAQKAVSYTFVDPNALMAPSNLTAQSTGRVKGQVVLNWVDNSQNETGFHIERATVPKSGTPQYLRIASVGANIKTFTQTVTAGSYLYRVQAYSTPLNKVSAYATKDVRVK